MVNPISFTDPLAILQKSLDALASQHEVIANNLANIDTPNFKRSVVSFQDKLRVALDQNPDSPLWRTNPMHFPIAKPISLDDSNRTSKPLMKPLAAMMETTWTLKWNQGSWPKTTFCTTALRMSRAAIWRT